MFDTSINILARWSHFGGVVLGKLDLYSTGHCYTGCPTRLGARLLGCGFIEAVCSSPVNNKEFTINIRCIM